MSERKHCDTFVPPRLMTLAMQTSLASVQECLDALSCPAWVFDPDTLAFLAVNQTALDEYGYTRDEFLRLTLLDIRPTEDIKTFLAVMRQQGFVGSHGHWRHWDRWGRVFDVTIECESCEVKGRRALLAQAEIKR